jgi:hypothetical protein
MGFHLDRSLSHGFAELVEPMAIGPPPQNGHQIEVLKNQIADIDERLKRIEVARQT